MRNIIKILIFIFTLTSNGAIAKNLPPESRDKRTLFNYNDYRLRYNTYPGDKKSKQVYSYPFISNAHFSDKYIIPLYDGPPSDLLKKKPWPFSSDNLLDIKPWEMPKFPPSKYFNHLSIMHLGKLECPVTPSLKQIVIKKEEKFRPKEFLYSNNLRRKVKMPVVAAGDVIYIQGQLQDVNCTPIPYAVVKLWQTDAYGMIDKGELDVDFQGNGTAVSDNLGIFSFITILPGAAEKIAPHINISIEHDYFSTISTKFYFPQHKKNDIDVMLNSLDKYNQNLITSELIPVNFNNLAQGYMMLFNLTLNGISPYNNVN
jgi:protocatechuate 3,4-dioxygenase beta subunit